MQVVGEQSCDLNPGLLEPKAKALNHHPIQFRGIPCVYSCNNWEVVGHSQVS